MRALVYVCAVARPQMRTRILISQVRPAAVERFFYDFFFVFSFDFNFSLVLVIVLLWRLWLM